MERVIADLEQLNKALDTLENAFIVAKKAAQMGDAEFILAAEDSIIQRFEYSYEAFWKLLKKYIEQVHRIEEINSPRRVVHAAVTYNICSTKEGTVFLEMLDDRNETSHRYSVEAIRIILPDIPRYFEAMRTVVDRLHEKTTQKSV
jgi:nucleotidyltransferase substrate binding protein (TIGR01987 family)